MGNHDRRKASEGRGQRRRQQRGRHPYGGGGMQHRRSSLSLFFTRYSILIALSGRSEEVLLNYLAIPARLNKATATFLLLGIMAAAACAAMVATVSDNISPEAAPRAGLHTGGGKSVFRRRQVRTEKPG